MILEIFMIWYDMIWYDMIWYDMIYDIRKFYHMISYDIIWYHMISKSYDIIIWYDIRKFAPNKQTNRQTDKQTKKHMNKQTEKQRNKQTNKQTASSRNNRLVFSLVAKIASNQQIMWRKKWGSTILNFFDQKLSRFLP